MAYGTKRSGMDDICGTHLIFIESDHWQHLTTLRAYISNIFAKIIIAWNPTLKAFPNLPVKTRNLGIRQPPWTTHFQGPFLPPKRQGVALPIARRIQNSPPSPRNLVGLPSGVSKCPLLEVHLRLVQHMGWYRNSRVFLRFKFGMRHKKLIGIVLFLKIE